jgi:hypothetical protein
VIKLKRAALSKNQTLEQRKFLEEKAKKLDKAQAKKAENKHGMFNRLNINLEVFHSLDNRTD